MIATITRVAVSFRPSNEKDSAISTGDKTGVEIMNARILPTAAPLLNNPIPSGIVPQEHKGRIVPTLIALSNAVEDLPPGVFEVNFEVHNTAILQQ